MISAEAASSFCVGIHLGVIPHARLGPELQSAKCDCCYRCHGQALERRHQLGRGSHPKALRERDALCHFGLPAGLARLNGWENWQALPNWRFVYAPPPLQPLQLPLPAPSLRPQFRTDETAGMRYAFPNEVPRAHAHTAAAALSLCSDRARSRPCRLPNDNQLLPPPS
jgi:hypothetical protein